VRDVEGQGKRGGRRKRGRRENETGCSDVWCGVVENKGETGRNMERSRGSIRDGVSTRAVVWCWKMSNREFDKMQGKKRQKCGVVVQAFGAGVIEITREGK
jgi:hypothetical protein